MTCRCACGCQRPVHRDAAQITRCRGCRWNPGKSCAQTKHRMGGAAWIEAELERLAEARNRNKWRGGAA